jgi:hypothetical protein
MQFYTKKSIHNLIVNFQFQFLGNKKNKKFIFSCFVKLDIL